MKAKRVEIRINYLKKYREYMVKQQQFDTVFVIDMHLNSMLKNN